MANTTMWLAAATGDDPNNIDALKYTGIKLRQLDAAVYKTEGVLSRSALRVTERAIGANMSVDVAPGGALIDCDSIPNGGRYFSAEDAVVNVPVPVAPGSGTRTHLVVERVFDKAIIGGSEYGGRPFLVEDTGSGATVPGSALLLASISVAAGQPSVQNSNITGARALACAGDTLLDWSKSPSNTDSSANAGTEQGTGDHVTFTLAKPALIRFDWGMWITNNSGGATSGQSNLRRIAGTSSPGATGGNVVWPAQQPFGSAQSASLIGKWIDSVPAGTWTYGTTFIPHIDKAYKNGSSNTGGYPSFLTATFLDLT